MDGRGGATKHAHADDMRGDSQVWKHWALALGGRRIGRTESVWTVRVHGKVPKKGLRTWAKLGQAHLGGQNCHGG